MKIKSLCCTLALSIIFLGGCAGNNSNAQGIDNSVVGDSAQNSATNMNADMITENEAKEIALTHAGVAAEYAVFIKSELEREDGQRIFDVEFYTTDHKEYDYEIDPYTGEILDYDFDAENYTQSTVGPDAH